ncbi:MAG: SDR family NAD(P)-dependent oxidoreductase [Acidobacteria bacterium]|nr:SDR family NAD(P)-dependent oxidoreductase [Acidobacteriota bacterium]
MKKERNPIIDQVPDHKPTDRTQEQYQATPRSGEAPLGGDGRRDRRPPLAIVGMGCRFPGAQNLAAYWRNILEGVCSIGELPPHRFNRARYYDPVVGAYGKSYSSIGGCIAESEFDWRLYNIPPKVVASTDITQLWALEVAKETFEHAGLDPFGLSGANCGVVLGHARGSMLTTDMAFATAIEGLLTALDQTAWYPRLPTSIRESIRQRVIERVHGRYPARTEDGGPGTITSAVAGLITNVFGLTGRHMVVDAACASSLAAVDIGARALWSGRLDMALVGGVSYSQELSVVMFAQSRALSATGSFPFDARANGFISSDGVGMVLVKRLDDAMRDGNTIYGLLRGVGGSCDGKGKALWAPRREGQVVAIARAYEACDVDPATIGLVEAHGTSTELGDATEVEALTEFFGPHIKASMSVPVGSVKGNIGHTREAAGIAGLIKSVMALHAKTLPPSINYDTPNKNIHWEKTPFRHSGDAQPWPLAGDGSPRRAVVDAFGIGGLNYHVILEEAPATPIPLPIAATYEVPHDREPIAIIGIGAKLPGAADVVKFYRMLRAGRHAMTAVTDDRWKADIYYAPGDRRTYRTYCKVGGFVSDYRPDWQRFKMPPKLVESNDPLQFMLLEAAVDALTDAGYDKKAYDRRRVSVLVGSVFGSDFALQLALALRMPEVCDELKAAMREENIPPAELDHHLKEFEACLGKLLPRINEDSSGSFSSSTLASRIAKTLDLMGPTFAVDAACASSLAAAEIGVESLRAGDCDMVICGGGERAMRVQRFEGYCQFYSLSRSGQCSPFDQNADGFLPGEGVGILLLKRLKDAVRDGDKVYAVIRGVGSSSDGERKSLHRPSVNGLTRAMKRAYEDARQTPEKIAYIECHGAGTPVGDATEVAAVRELFCTNGPRRPVILGSVKANIGHTQGAAGVSALIKTTLAIHHGELPPTPHFQSPPPSHQFGSHLRVNTQLEPFPGLENGRAAGVSAMGLAGINYHFVLEGHGAPQPYVAAHRSLVKELTVRKDHGKVVTLRAADLATLLGRAPALAARANELFTAGADTAEGGTMVAIAAESAAGLAKQLTLLAAQGNQPAARVLLESQGIFLPPAHLGTAAKTCFLFPGQGSQYPGMMKELAELRLEARSVLLEYDELLMAEGRASLSEVLWGDVGLLSVDVFYTQAAVLAGNLMGFAVAEALGLRPDFVTGHSYGEYPALVAAGVLTRAEALGLTARRCDAIVRAGDKQGAMASVFADRATVNEVIKDVHGYVIASNINSPQQVVISGESSAVEDALARFQARAIEARRLSVPGAFHSGLMKAAAHLFEQAMANVSLQPPTTPILSSVGAVRRSDPLDLRAALVTQFTEPVDFIAQIEHAYADGARLFIEVGPGQILSKLAREILGQRAAIIVAIDDKKHPGAFPLTKVQAAAAVFKAAVADQAAAAATIRSSAPAGEKLPARSASRPEEADVPADLCAAAIFTTEQWQFLTAQPQFAPLWTMIRPTLAGLAADLCRRFTAALPSVVDQPEQSSIPANQAEASAANPEEVRRFIIEQVCHFTGYPAELIAFDQDLEADLGIDTVKQAQVLGRLREHYNLATDETLSLRDFPTLQHVWDYVLKQKPKATPPAMATQRETTRPVAALPGNGSFAETSEFHRLFGFGAVPAATKPATVKFFDATTGRGEESYAHVPLKLRAKLAATRPPAVDPLTPTSPGGNEAVSTGYGSRRDTSPPAPLPNGHESKSGQRSIAPADGKSAPASFIPPTSVSTKTITDYLLTVLSDQTGYPREILDLDQDLEADLGIDTVKQAQTLGKVREHFNLRTDDTLSLRDFPTLRQIITYVAEQCAGRAPAEVTEASLPTTALKPSLSAMPPATACGDGSVAASTTLEVRETVVRLFCEATGYPPELLALDQDLEADLGIDTVKQAQTFGKLREIYDLDTDDSRALRDFPTLGHIIDYIEQQNEAKVRNEPHSPAIIPSHGKNGDKLAAESNLKEQLTRHEPVSCQGPSFDLQIVHLDGSPYEMGRKHGDTLSGAIRHVLEVYEKFVTPEGVKKEILQDALRRPELYFDDEALEEIRGVADGTGLPYRHMLAYNLDSALFGEYTVGCTQFLRRSAGHLRHAVNEDSPLALYLGDALTRVMQVRRPTGKIPCLFFSLAGQVAGLAGINAQSLSVTSSILVDRARQAPAPGHIHALLVKRILQEASDTSQAQRLSEGFPRTGAWAMLLCDGRQGDGLYMEYDGAAFHAETVAEQFEATNHAQRLPPTAPAPEHSHHRLTRIKQLLTDFPAAGVTDTARLMRDRFDLGRGREVTHPTMNTIRRVDNVMTLVMDPKKRRVTVSNGWRSDGSDPELLELEADVLWSAVDRENGANGHGGTRFEICDIPLPAATGLIPIPEGKTVSVSNPHEGVGGSPAARAATVTATGSGETSAAAKDVTSRLTSIDEIMRRHVIRAVPQALINHEKAKGSYRPERMVVVGDDALAQAVTDSLTSRGTRILKLADLSNPSSAAQELKHWLQSEGPADICLTIGYRSERRIPLTQATAADWHAFRQSLVDLPYRVLQIWTQHMQKAGALKSATLSAITSLGGVYGFENAAGLRSEGGPLIGLLKAIRREFDPLRVKALDVGPLDTVPVIIDHFLSELDSGDRRLEVGWLQGQRHVLKMLPWKARPSAEARPDQVKNWLVTGGGRGVTAVIAQALAREFHAGIHLVGATSLPSNAEALAAKSPEELADLKMDLLRTLKAERAHVTPVEWETAWKSTAKAAEIARNLAQMRAAGAKVWYHACDVSEPAALAALLDQIRTISGPIGGVVHGAGTEQAKPYDRKAAAMVAATLSPKLDGAWHLLRLLEPDRPSYFVAFASVSGRFGGHGQTDYSMANEGMVKLIAEYRTTHPDCHAVAISWAAWGEIGMATRPESMTFLEASGQRFMSPAEGIQHFLRELRSDNREAEVTVVERVDALDMDKILPKLEAWPGYDRLAAAAGATALLADAEPLGAESVRAEIVLDPDRDAFLTEHRLGPTPILPAVIGCEIMAETAALLPASSSLIGLKDLTIHTPLKFSAGRRVRAYGLATRAGADLRIRLTAGFYNREGLLIEPERTLFTGAALYADCPESVFSVRPVEAQVKPLDFHYPAAFDTDVKSRMIFHGPPLRGLRRVFINPGDDHLAEIEAPATEGLRAGTTPAQWQFAAAALDTCLQACGVIGRVKLAAMALPGGFGVLRFGRQPAEGEALQLFVHFRDFAEGRLHFDFELVGADGRPIVCARDYRAHTFAVVNPKASRQQSV